MPATPTIPTTLLEATNELLRAVGRAAVSSLEDIDMNLHAQEALSVLNSTCVETQSRGWHFNEETDYPLEPNGDGEIVLPDNTAAVRFSERSASKDVTQRGNKLYDKRNRTYIFSEPVYVDIVFLFDFADMPQPHRWYNLALAGRKFAVGRVPDTSTYRFTKQVEDDALAAVEQYDSWATNRVASEVNPHFANMRRR